MYQHIVGDDASLLKLVANAKWVNKML